VSPNHDIRLGGSQLLGHQRSLRREHEPIGTRDATVNNAKRPACHAERHEFGKACHPIPAIEGDPLASEAIPTLRQLMAAEIVSKAAPAILCIKRELFLTIAGYHVTAPGSDRGNRLLRLRAIGHDIARANRVCGIDTERRGSRA
jgi:hypothetical protein